MERDAIDRPSSIRLKRNASAFFSERANFRVLRLAEVGGIVGIQRGNDRASINYIWRPERLPVVSEFPPNFHETRFACNRLHRNAIRTFVRASSSYFQTIVIDSILSERKIDISPLLERFADRSTPYLISFEQRYGNRACFQAI